MKKLYTYIKKTTFVLAVIAFSVVMIPKTALATGDTDWGYGGFDSSYDDYSYEISPNYYYPEDNYSYEISPNYYYDTPSYSYSGGSGYTYYTPKSSYSGGYSYPSYNYVYTPSKTSSSGYSPSAGLQYVYSSNTNSNTNTNTNTATANNTNTITNTFNPVNNNDARINLVVLGGGGSGNNNNNYSQLSGSCSISPSTAYVNQDVSFSASASGGNGGYTYSWTGDNGIYSSSQSFTGRFSYPGVKNATVTIRSSDGQSITRSCSTTVQDTYTPVNGAYCVANPTVAGINQNVTWTVYPGYSNYYNTGYTYYWSGTDGLSGYGQTVSRVYNTPGYKTASVTIYGNGQSTVVNCGATVQGGIVSGTSNVTVLRDQTPTGTPVAGVFLNQVPDTGISLGLKVTLFTLGLILWSIFGAYVLSRKAKLQTANGASLSKIESFKRANMAKKGIDA